MFLPHPLHPHRDWDLLPTAAQDIHLWAERGPRLAGGCHQVPRGPGRVSGPLLSCLTLQKSTNYEARRLTLSLSISVHTLSQKRTFRPQLPRDTAGKAWQRLRRRAQCGAASAPLGAGPEQAAFSVLLVPAVPGSAPQSWSGGCRAGDVTGGGSTPQETLPATWPLQPKPDRRWGRELMLPRWQPAGLPNAGQSPPASCTALMPSPGNTAPVPLTPAAHHPAAPATEVAGNRLRCQ